MINLNFIFVTPSKKRPFSDRGGGDGFADPSIKVDQGRDRARPEPI
jgi:hypothetical protein